MPKRTRGQNSPAETPGEIEGDGANHDNAQTERYSPNTRGN